MFWTDGIRAGEIQALFEKLEHEEEWETFMAFSLKQETKSLIVRWRNNSWWWYMENWKWVLENLERERQTERKWEIWGGFGGDGYFFFFLFLFRANTQKENLAS